MSLAIVVVVVVVVWGQDPVVADAAPPSPRHLGESASAGQCTSRRGHQTAQVSCSPPLPHIREIHAKNNLRLVCLS